MRDCSRITGAQLVLACLSLQVLLGLPAYAASSDSLVTAIKSADIFKESVSITATSEGDQVKVSTYLNKNANDQDCKIDAVLISKAVMDAAPEAQRCKVYFYNSANLSEFKEVSVTAAEVKAFSTGAIAKDKLLASLAITSKHATVTPDEMVAAIKRAGILPADARITARLDGDQAKISTYRNRKASDQDCKIDAMLVSKVLMDLAPNDIARISAYFFNSRDLASYKEVQVTSGDVKVFGAGAVGQEKLLASLPVKEGQIADPNRRVSDYLEDLQGASLNQRLDVTIEGNELNVSTLLSSSISDREAKLQGLMLAEHSLSVVPAGVGKIKVKFLNPSRRESYREVTFDVGLVKSLGTALDSALSSVGLVSYGKPTEPESTAAAPGILEAERNALLERIKDLERKGVGVTPFVAAFTAMEAEVPSGDETRVRSAMKRLASALDSQEKAYKDAKDRPVTTKAAAVPTGPIKPRTAPRLTRYGAMGNMPITDSEILSDPDRVVSKVEDKLRSERINPAQSLRMYNALLYVAQVLTDNDRAAEGVKFDTKAANLRAASPRLQ